MQSSGKKPKNVVVFSDAYSFGLYYTPEEFKGQQALQRYYQAVIPDLKKDPDALVAIELPALRFKDKNLEIKPPTEEKLEGFGLYNWSNKKQRIFSALTHIEKVVAAGNGFARNKGEVLRRPLTLDDFKDIAQRMLVDVNATDELTGPAGQKYKAIFKKQ